MAIDDAAAFAPLARLLDDHRGARGEVRASVAVPPKGEAGVLLGRDYRLDAELAGHIEMIPGVRAVNLRMSETKLRAVG